MLSSNYKDKVKEKPKTEVKPADGNIQGDNNNNGAGNSTLLDDKTSLSSDKLKEGENNNTNDNTKSKTSNDGGLTNTNRGLSPPAAFTFIVS